MRTLPRLPWLVGAVVVLVSGAARAAIPADYKGMPFDPAVEGGVGIIPATVKAGPYSIPGRLDFVNYDMGGSGVAFHAGDHITSKQGAGYRKGTDVATFSKTGVASKDIWYMSGTAMDGMTYPDATTQDFYIGAVQVNDWFNFTVNVQTAGMYTVSSTWSSGNGPPGGEGGDGSMGLQIYANGTKLADWKSSWPDFNTTADFHHWKPYDTFATVMLDAGPQVIKLQSTSKHLNLDYVDFKLMGAGTTGAGGASGGAGASGTGGSAGSAGSAGSGGSGGSTGAAGSDTTGTAGAGVAGDSGATGVAGSVGTTGAAGDGAGTSGTAGASAAGTAGATGAGTAGSGVTAGTAGTGGPKQKSGGCAVAGTTSSLGWLGLGAAAAALALGRRRRRRA